MEHVCHDPKKLGSLTLPIPFGFFPTIPVGPSQTWSLRPIVTVPEPRFHEVRTKKPRKGGGLHASGPENLGSRGLRSTSSRCCQCKEVAGHLESSSKPWRPTAPAPSVARPAVFSEIEPKEICGASDKDVKQMENPSGQNKTPLSEKFVLSIVWLPSYSCVWCSDVVQGVL